MQYLFVGLGNPGKEYEMNRHNVGFMAIDSIVDRYNFSSYIKKFKGLFSKGKLAGNDVFVLKPETFMNKSGISVAEIVNFYKIEPENIFVIYDELDLKLASVRVKNGGGSGGHNGIKSIDSFINNNYNRIRIGIGHPGDKNKVSSYVLSNFSNDEQHIVDAMLEAISCNIDYLLVNNHSEFMNKIALKVNSLRE